MFKNIRYWLKFIKDRIDPKQPHKSIIENAIIYGINDYETLQKGKELEKLNKEEMKQSMDFKKRSWKRD